MGYGYLRSNKHGWFDGNGVGGGGFPKSDSLVFYGDLINTLVPDVGTTPTFVRASAKLYPNTFNTLENVTSGNPAFGTLWGLSSGISRGIVIDAKRKNLNTQSASFGSWTKISGTETVTANGATAPNGAMEADRVQGTGAGNGLTISTAEAAANKSVIVKVYMLRSTGTATPILRVEDGTNSEGSQITMTPTVSNNAWDEYHVTHVFSGSASGTIVPKIIVGNTGTDVLYFWGAMTQAYIAGYTAPGDKIISMIPTSLSTAVTDTDYLSLASADVSGITAEGSVSQWIVPKSDSNQATMPGGQGILFTMNNYGLLVFQTTGTSTVMYYAGTSLMSIADTRAALTPAHYVTTWKLTGGNVTAYIYKNGSQLATATSARSEPTGAAMYIGSYNNGGTPQLVQQGLHSRVRVWSTQISGPDALSVYNMEKQYYGI